MNINHMYIELTSICNLNCLMCYNNSGQDKHYLDYGVITEFIEKALTYNLQNVIISGGEPTFYPQIYELLDFLCNDKKYKNVILISNGTTSNVSEIAQKYFNKIQTVQFSLDSHLAEVHNYIRGKRAYERLMANWNEIVEMGFGSIIAVNCVLNKLNIEDIEKIINLCISKNSKGIKFEFILPQGRALSHRELLLSYAEMYSTYQKIYEYKEKYSSDLDIILPQIKSSCPFMKKINNQTFPRIDCKGNVYPCSALTNEMFIIGNIYENTFEDIFNEENMNKKIIHNALCLKNKCKKCVLHTICESGCLGYYLEGSQEEFDAMCGLRKINLLRQIR